MADVPPFVDIHCHLIPGIDDGAKSWDQTLAMARMAVEDGIETIVCTPHQLGSFGHNSGSTIRQRTAELQQVLRDHRIPLTVLPGGDVRIEPDMVPGLAAGRVVSLGDHRRHVLLELPHELYMPLEGVLQQLAAHGMVGILSHPERNQGILQDPRVLGPLVEAGCLMQVTAGSLTGTFGADSQALAERMLADRQVHFLATDAHGPQSRRPLLRRAYMRAGELVGEPMATALCCTNPRAVAEGRTVPRLPAAGPSKPSGRRWFNWRRVA